MTTQAEALALVRGYFAGTVDKATAINAATSYNTGEYMKNRNAVYSIVGSAAGSGTSRTIFKNGENFGTMQIPAGVDELAYVCGQLSDASTVNGMSCSLAQNTPIIYTPNTGSAGIDVSTGQPPANAAPNTSNAGSSSANNTGIPTQIIIVVIACLILLFSLIRRK